MPHDSEQRDPSEVMYRGVMGIVGLALFFGGAGMVAYAIYSLITAGFAAGTVVTLAVMCLATLAGVVMLRASRAKGANKKKSDDADLLEGSRQRGVLRTARKYQGRLTLAEVTLETRLDVDEARKLLDKFEMQGVCEMQISDAGQEVYVFSAFTDDGRDKLTARSPLDEDAEVELLFEQLAEEQEENRKKNEREQASEQDKKAAEEAQVASVSARSSSSARDASEDT